MAKDPTWENWTGNQKVFAKEMLSPTSLKELRDIVRTVSARGGRGVSVGLSLLAFVVYYSMLTSGEKLADRGFVDPWIGMWLPNIVLGVFGIWLLQRAVRDNPRVDLRLDVLKARSRKIPP